MNVPTNPALTPSTLSGIERLTYTIDEAAIILGISRSTAYECARRGQIPFIRLGRRLVVPAAAIRAILEP